MTLFEHLEARAETRVSACYQCQKCASGCPIASSSEFLPSQIIQMIRLGNEREALGSRAIWLCVTCSTCAARCPQGIDLARVMDALRHRAVEESAVPVRAPETIFNEAFLKSVRRHGRAFEMGLMTAFKLRSGDFRRDVEKFPSMVLKGKIALLPNRGGDRQSVRGVFEKLDQAESKS